MANSFNANLESLKFFMRKLDSPELKAKVADIAHEKGIIAIISQAIANNFELEGPGWPALKAQTIRWSVKGKAKKAISDMTDAEIEHHEKAARKSGDDSVQPFRRILQLTGLLKKTATTANYTGSGKAKPGKPAVSGSNVYRVENTTVIWGTNLVYANAHNSGDAKRGIPKREFLTIRPEWQAKLDNWAMTQTVKYLRQTWAEVLK